MSSLDFSLRNGGSLRISKALALLLIAFWATVRPATAASSGPWVFLLDTNQSTVRISLDALGKSDTQTAHLDGNFVLGFDRLLGPTQAGLADFALRSIGTVNFKIDFGTGKGTAKVPAYEVRRLSPLDVPDLSPLVGGKIKPSDIPYQTAGNGSYAVTGTPCLLLQLGGFDCAGDVDFGASPPGTFSEIDLQVTSTPGEIRVRAGAFFTQPLDPTNPNLATVSGVIDAVGVLSLVSVEATRPTPDTLLLRWPVTLGAASVQAADSLQSSSWSALPQVPVTNGAFVEVILPVNPGAAQKFLRVR